MEKLFSALTDLVDWAQTGKVKYKSELGDHHHYQYVNYIRAGQSQEDLTYLLYNYALLTKLLIDMVRQYCVRTVTKTGTPQTYTHEFMSIPEEVFEYLVEHKYAKWCEDGIDIYDLKYDYKEDENG